MPELAEDSFHWIEMKGISVRLQGRIVLEKIDWIFRKNEHWAINNSTSFSLYSIRYYDFGWLVLGCIEADFCEQIFIS